MRLPSPRRRSASSPNHRLRFPLALCLLGLGVPGAAFPSTVVDGPQGTRIYDEDFTVPAAVDAGAGPGTGLDETEIDGGDALVQSDSGALLQDFDVAGDYTFDPAELDVSGGAVRLVGTSAGAALVGYWRMEEAAWNGTPGEVVDSSGQGNDGAALAGADTVAAGLLGRAGSFDGSQGIAIPPGAALDLNGQIDEFTVVCWFKATGDGALVGKAVADICQRQYYLYLDQGRLNGNVGGIQNNGSVSGLDDDQWHQAVLVNQNQAGVFRYTLYVDGAADGTFNSGSNTNTADFLVAARRVSGNTGLGFALDGEVDEVAVFDRALTAAEVADLYNGGAGRIVQSFSTGGPAIFETAGDAPAPDITAFTGFTADFGPAHAGDTRFQLSTDGVVWRFWDGAAWSPAATDADRSDAATVNAQIAAFPTGPLWVRSFLLSGGNQQVEIDRLTATYARPPRTSSSEILGPVTSGLRFDAFSAVVSGEDPDHTLRFRFLQGDGATPYADALIPGNAAGFDSAQAAAGVDLSAVGAGDLYVEAVFSNAVPDAASARLESFRVVFLDTAPNADLAVEVTDVPDPVALGGAIDYGILVTNRSATLEALGAELTFPAPAGTSISARTTAPGWTCDPPSPTLLRCLRTTVPAGSTASFMISVDVPPGYGGPNPISATATVTAANEGAPGDNVATAETVVDAATPGSLRIVLDAVPDTDTDFPYTSPQLGSFLLDEDPGDGDGIGPVRFFPSLAPGTYTVQQTVPTYWLLDRIECASNPLALEGTLPFSDPGDYVFDPTRIEVTGGAVRLVQDAIAPALLAYWRLEEPLWNGTPGEAADDSGNGVTGTAAGDAQTFAPGLLGRAGTFDGAGDYVTFGQPASLDLDASVDEFSISAWFRTNGPGAIVGKAVSGLFDRQFYVFVYQNRIYTNMGGSQQASDVVGIDDGQWHHVAVVIENINGLQRQAIYIDGVVDRAGLAVGNGTNAADVMIGARRNSGNSGSGFHFSGDIDEVAIIGKPLTALEVASVYDGGSGRVIAGGFPTDSPTVTGRAIDDPDLTAFTGFTEVTGPGHQGEIRYQLSPDGTTWYHHDGATWVVAGAGDHDSAAEVDAAIAAFGPGLAARSLWVRAFLISDGLQAVVLDHVSAAYTSDGLASLTTTPVSFTVDLQESQDLVCTFVNLEDPPPPGSVTLVEDAFPRDGTDFPFFGEVGTGVLDDAFPDDGDGVGRTATFGGLDAGTYAFQQDLPSGWTLTSFLCELDLSPSELVVDFDDPARYTFDPLAVEIAASEARLRQNPIGAGLEGYWRMDEDAWVAGVPGQVGDSSGNGLEGTAFADARIVAGGVIGNAGDFDGSADHVALGQPAALDFDPAVDTFTLSAWFKTPIEGALLGKAVADAAQRQYYLFVFNGRLWGNVGGLQNSGATLGVDDDRWHHAALVAYDAGGSMRYSLYLDGQLDGDFASGTATNGADLLIGGRRNVGNTGIAFLMFGQIDEAAVWSRDLSAAEIQALYNDGAGRFAAPFDDAVPSVLQAGGQSTGPVQEYLFFEDEPGLSSLGSVEYQLSNDGATWYWAHPDDGWQTASGDGLGGLGEYSDALTVDDWIDLFPAGERLWIRAFLVSDGVQPVAVDRVTLGYRISPLTAPGAVGATGTVGVGWDQDLVCHFNNELADPGKARLLVRLDAEPADGTPFPFAGSFGAFELTDPGGDPNAEVFGRRAFLGVDPGSHTLEAPEPAGWLLASVACTGLATPPTDLGAVPGGRAYAVTLGAGEEGDCTVSYAPASRTVTLTQVTDTDGALFDALSADSEGDTWAVTSDADLAAGNGGDNSDGGHDLFVVDGADVSQVTDLTIAAFFPFVGTDTAKSGDWVVFATAEDPLGTNGDGNEEIFRYAVATGVLTQITDTSGCLNASPKVSDDGQRIAFTTRCSDAAGLSTGLPFNVDGSTEVVLWDAGTVRFVETASCEGFPTDLTADGTVVTLRSTCDLAANGNDEEELFQWEWQGGSPFVQITELSSDDGEVASGGVASADGRFVLFLSNAAPGPGVGPMTLYRWDRVTGIPQALTAPGRFFDNGADLDLDASGGRAAFVGDSGIQAGDLVLMEILAGGSVLETTIAAGFPKEPHVGVDDDGNVTVLFRSDGDPLGTNADGGDEVFRASVE
ncbi:MAG: LamG-like jellyroll fold domain-containing protein [Acidobacteriota bacterium]